MSHNAKCYRKKLTKKTSETCKRIDFLFRQAALSSSCAESELDRCDEARDAEILDSSPANPEPLSPTHSSPSEDDIAVCILDFKIYVVMISYEFLGLEIIHLNVNFGK